MGGNLIIDLNAIRNCIAKTEDEQEKKMMYDEIQKIEYNKTEVKNMISKNMGLMVSITCLLNEEDFHKEVLKEKLKIHGVKNGRLYEYLMKEFDKVIFKDDMLEKIWNDSGMTNITNKCIERCNNFNMLYEDIKNSIVENKEKIADQIGKNAKELIKNNMSLIKMSQTIDYDNERNVYIEIENHRKTNKKYIKLTYKNELPTKIDVSDDKMPLIVFDFMKNAVRNCRSLNMSEVDI